MLRYGYAFESLVSEEVTETFRVAPALGLSFESLASEEVTETDMQVLRYGYAFESLVSEEVTETANSSRTVST